MRSSSWIRTIFLAHAVALAVAFFGAAVPSLAGRTPTQTRDDTSLGRFSLAAPKGWRLDAASKGGGGHNYLLDPDHAYYMRPVGLSEPIYIVEVRAESAVSPETAQSLTAVRMRSGVIDARENEIRRSELRSHNGIRIWKADYRTNFSAPHSGKVLPVHSVLYSFRGPDGHVYTLLCWPKRNESAQGTELLDEVARSIRF